MRHTVWIGDTFSLSRPGKDIQRDNVQIWDTGGAHRGHQGDVHGLEGTSEHRGRVKTSGLKNGGATMQPCSPCDLPSCGIYT
jgi:hypothetical protein